MLICVTHRRLCREDFLFRMDQLASGKPDALVLREKDLDAAAYEQLARDVKEICDRYGVRLILHQNTMVAEKMGHPYLHLSFAAFRAYRQYPAQWTVGVSVHSVIEAKEAQNLGAAYLFAGHIFATESKKGVSPRGLSFLRQVCQSVAIPVFAIGGIDLMNKQYVMAAGARGFCIMSESMTCEEPAMLAKAYKTSESYASFRWAYGD